MQGNVAEWVTGRDGKPVTKGGSYLDGAEKLKVAAREPDNPAWNASDPQVPKSGWWLVDGPFVGFRVVREGPGDSAKTDKPDKNDRPGTDRPAPGQSDDKERTK
jgi:hypothetical protein